MAARRLELGALPHLPDLDIETNKDGRAAAICGVFFFTLNKLNFKDLVFPFILFRNRCRKSKFGRVMNL